MSRRESDHENWGGSRPGAGRPKHSPIDKDGKGLVVFKFGMWVYLLPIKRLTFITGTVIKDGQEIPIVYSEGYKMWYEFGCIDDRIDRMYGSLTSNLIVDERQMPLTKEAETVMYR
jgi:hypothetical protein